MKLNELLELISQKMGYSVNQSMLADIFGVTRQTISNRIKNDSELTVSELKKIEEFFNIRIFLDNNLSNDEVIFLDYYNDVFASCGNGSIVFSEEKQRVSISSMFINNYSKQRKYSMINATGDSMSPTIENGDKLIVEHWNDSQIQDNKIYVFCFNNEFFVKRLSKNLDEIIIKSDNPDYRTRTINGTAGEELQLVGKIVGIIKSVV